MNVSRKLSEVKIDDTVEHARHCVWFFMLAGMVEFQGFIFCGYLSSTDPCLSFGAMGNNRRKIITNDVKINNWHYINIIDYSSNQCHLIYYKSNRPMCEKNIIRTVLRCQTCQRFQPEHHVTWISTKFRTSLSTVSSFQSYSQSVYFSAHQAQVLLSTLD